MKIFIQIASYRDPQLITTVRDALDKATHPENLSFGICNQYCDDDPWRADEVFVGNQFRVIEIPYQESRGACWARRKVQELWQGEEYALQLDSHHLFAEGWDETLIDMYNRCPSDSPIITGYVPQCPVDGEAFCEELYEMLPHFELDRVILQFKPSIRSDSGLKRHMLWSGHFMFTEGAYCEKVPYDTDLYFIGEEITMAVRSYTSGYDMFYPDKPCVWHEYGRAMRPKHWSDHKVEDDVNTAFFTLDAVSKKKVKQILYGEDVNSCGLGSVRTLKDYENAAGLSFKNSYVSTEAMNFTEAPVFKDDSWREVEYTRYTIEVDWSEHKEHLEEYNPSQIAVFVRDARRDFNLEDGVVYNGTLTAQWTTKPTFAEIWPYRCDPLEWGKKFEAKIVRCDEEKVS